MAQVIKNADIAIIGTGPAGISAAITAKIRNKEILLFGGEPVSSKVAKAHQILNYPQPTRSFSAACPELRSVRLQRSVQWRYRLLR